MPESVGPWPLVFVVSAGIIVACMSYGAPLDGAFGQGAHREVPGVPEPGTYHVLDVNIEVFAHVTTDVGGAVRHDVAVSMANNAGVDSVGISLVADGAARDPNCGGTNAWVRVGERVTAWSCFMLPHGERPDAVIIYDGFAFSIEMSNRVDGMYHIKPIYTFDRPPVPGLWCSYGDGWAVCH